MRVPAVALLLLLGGCHLPPASAPTTEPDAYSEAAPLEARILPYFSGQSFAFRVNRPSYVAVFDVTPGVGVSLLYPRIGSTHRVYAGTESVAWQWAWSGAHTQYDYAAFAGVRGPRFLYLIASEEPLDLSDVGHAGHRLRTSMGVQFASVSPFNTMERLARAVVPNLSREAGWTTDYFVYWPDTGRMQEAYASRTVSLYCNGARYYVPAAFASSMREYICDMRERQNSPPATQPNDSTGEQPGDPDAPEKPGRRRPLSPETRVTDRIRVSSQIQEWTSEARLAHRVSRFGREYYGGGSEPRVGAGAVRDYPRRDSNPQTPAQAERPTSDRPAPPSAPAVSSPAQEAPTRAEEAPT